MWPLEPSTLATPMPRLSGPPSRSSHRPPASVINSDARGDVPRVRGVAFEEGIDAAGRDVRQAQRRRTEGRACRGPSSTGRRSAVRRPRSVPGRRTGGRCTRAHGPASRPPTPPVARHHPRRHPSERAVAEPRTTSAGRGEQFAAERFEDRADHDTVRIAERRPRRTRTAAHERSSTCRRGDRRSRCDRIRRHHRCLPRRGSRGSGNAFADDVEDRRLRRDVGPRDDRRALALELDLLRSSQPFGQHRTTGPGGRDRDFDVVVDVLHSGQTLRVGGGCGRLDVRHRATEMDWRDGRCGNLHTSEAVAPTTPSRGDEDASQHGADHHDPRGEPGSTDRAARDDA